MQLGTHEDHRVPVWQGKHDANARTGPTRDLGDRVAACVEHVAGMNQAAEPDRVSQRVRSRIDELNDLAGHAATRIEASERNVDLLQAPAEDDSEETTEWTKRRAPFSP